MDLGKPAQEFLVLQIIQPSLEKFSSDATDALQALILMDMENNSSLGCDNLQHPAKPIGVVCSLLEVRAHHGATPLHTFSAGYAN